MHNINALKAQLNPIFHLLALLGAHHILHVSRIRVKAQEYLDTRSPLRTGHLYPQEYPGTHF
jgi:hypothetical protein